MTNASLPACSRRTLLRGLGVSMALPWLESLPRAVAAAMTGRIVIDPFGVLNGTACAAAGLEHHRLGARL